MSNLKQLTRYSLLLTLISWAALTFAQSSNQSGTTALLNAQSDSDLPQTYTSKECGFSIALPGTQTPEHRSFKDKDGLLLNSYSFTWLTNIGVYRVRCIEKPAMVSGPVYSKSALDSLRDLLVSKNSTAKLTRDADISVDGFPGREIFLETSDGIFIQRFYLVRQTAFDMSVYLSAELRPAQLEAIKIFDSFKLLDSGNEVLGEVDKLLRSGKEIIYGACGSDEPQCKPTPGAFKGGTLNNKATSLPIPAYPPIAKAVHASGTVEVKVVTDEEGKVIAAQALSGHPFLQAAAVEAARQALFSPTLLDGKPIKIMGVISFNFRLN